jgi:hypothetical protein
MIPGLAVAVVTVSVWFSADRAAACGGCFSPTETVSTISDHRMAFAVGPLQTIIWDQIRYQGDAKDFAWVMPVPALPKVEVTDATFFDNLESYTAPTVQGPPPPTPIFGCGGASGSAAPEDFGEQPPVTVWQQGNVGPYQMVTISSDQPPAILDWLDSHGYAVPSSAEPVLDYYVRQKSYFVALRLQPQAGVDQMQPVRVTVPGQSPCFPLRMMTIGARFSLGMTIYVFAEGRVRPKSYYSETTLDDGELVWDSNANKSNYQDLFDAAVKSNGGTTWVTEFADQASRVADGSADYTTAVAGLATPYLTRLRTQMDPTLMTRTWRSPSAIPPRCPTGTRCSSTRVAGWRGET